VGQQFHKYLWHLTDHALLVEVAGQLRNRVSHFFRATAESLGPDGMRRHAKTHQELLDVIASGDQRAANARWNATFAPPRSASPTHG
jgi:DNA-binding GntR family transcriptional regulator